MTYLQTIKRPPKLTRAEEYQLFSSYVDARKQEDDKSESELLEIIITQFIHWATFMVRRIAWGVTTEDEATSLAVEALITVARNYNPEDGTRFCTYAQHRLRGMALTYAYRERAYRARQTSHKYHDRDYDKFDHDSIQTRASRRATNPFFQVETKAVCNRIEFLRVMDLLQDKATPFEQALVTAKLIEGLTYREIAARVGKSHERVRQIVQKTIKRIKRHATAIH
jgi:RNA polymerase sigma factor (sigma-70 family)